MAFLEIKKQIKLSLFEPILRTFILKILIKWQKQVQLFVRFADETKKK
jgi:hypothetical protein